MSPKELKKLVKTLRDLGVTHYKTADLELNLTPEAPIKAAKIIPATPEEEAEIKHKMENYKSIMQLGDIELVDRLFPDYTQQDEDQEEVESGI